MVYKYISDEDIMLMNSHKYTNGGWSILDRKMDNYWKFIQSLIPRVIIVLTFRI